MICLNYPMNPHETTITNATSANLQDLCTAMADAFSDYAIPVNLTLPAFRFMMRQRGLSPDASRIALINGEIAAIWLVSVRRRQSYLIASGTVPAYRGLGLGTQLAQAALQHLRGMKIESFQTEVLIENEKAAGLYRKIGMQRQREFACYNIKSTNPGGDTPAIGQTPWAQIADEAQTLLDWAPSWQNSAASIAATGDEIQYFCSYDNGALIGYVAVNPSNGTVHQIGVHPNARRQGIGTALIDHALAVSNGPLRLINLDAGDAGFAAFIRSFSYEQTAGQFELLMRL
ncbi:GNAT family N-acetyltransferase [Yoonia sp. BS5-3]|uniref:GNAT family N-acetyltransferase n=1 Tax=Yoonia phaeophyticola TaxID=3137369 RepID=A0ABZ2V7B6_9RHOB